jgi:Protein of unknown function (DUF4058)
MAMLFPGMDPYLEDPRLWSGFHARTIVYVCNHLQPLISPRYIAAIEERVFLEGPERERIPDVWLRKRKKKNGGVAVLEADKPVIVKVPDVEIHESFVTILDSYSGQNLVTVIELVSPTNKYQGPGRDSYLDKQKEVRQSKVHLVEIDLLRSGPHVLAVPEWVARSHGPYHYLACVNRADGERDEYDLYPRTLKQRLPKIGVPLAGNDPDVVLDVQAVVEQTYEDGCYADRIDYRRPCIPSLSTKERAWANQIIKKAKGKVISGAERRKPPRKS